MAIDRVETFLLRHPISPPRGPSIAYSSAHAYVLVKLTDSDGASGWGETYAIPGAAAILADIAPLILGADPDHPTPLNRRLWRASEQPYVASAVAIAIDDLRARRHGVSIATLYGGPRRERVRVYGASGGYIEGQDPSISWPAELEGALAAGLTAMKLQIGRYPMAHELPIIERLRERAPRPFDFCADGNAGFTVPGAIAMGRELERLDFIWWEEPINQWDGYAAFERVHAALDIALAGGEVLMGRNAARAFLERGTVDILQPEPVICGGIGEALWYAELARLHAVSVVPHTSASAIGISAAVQVIACLADPTRLPTVDPPLLEMGLDENPWRTHLLSTPFDVTDGWLTIPTGPGLGVDVDEAFVRSRSSATAEFRA